MRREYSSGKRGQTPSRAFCRVTADIRVGKTLFLFGGSKPPPYGGGLGYHGIRVAEHFHVSAHIIPFSWCQYTPETGGYLRGVHMVPRKAKKHPLFVSALMNLCLRIK